VFKLLDSDVGRPITHIPHEMMGVDPIRIVQDVQRSSRPAETEVRLRDGQWVLMRVVPYSIGQEAFSGIVISFVDISSVKRVEEELRHSQQLFSTVANLSPEMVWMSGLDKKCNWFNQTWLQFTGRTLEQEQGNGWLEGVHPEDMDICLREYSAAFDMRAPFSIRYRLRRHDGEYRLIVDEGRPRFDDKGDFAGYVGFCRELVLPDAAEPQSRSARAAARRKGGRA
jgi:two-component system CheB/CheR fusion protein